MPHTSVTLLILTGIGKLPEFKMAVTTSGYYILNFGCLPTSDKEERVISKSGMVENMGVKVEIAAPSVTSAQKLFPLPVLWPPS